MRVVYGRLSSGRSKRLDVFKNYFQIFSLQSFFYSLY